MLGKIIRRLIACVAVTSGVGAAYGQAAYAPPFEDVDCAGSAEAWVPICIDASEAASRALAMTRLRGEGSRGDAALEEAERLAAAAAHACAKAERWEDAERQVQAVAGLASDRAGILGYLPAIASHAPMCGGETYADAETAALDTYMSAERIARAQPRVAASCPGGAPTLPGAEARLARDAESRRCEWMSEVGRRRAGAGLDRLAEGDAASGLAQISHALRAYDEAQPACRGLAREEVAERRAALSDLITQALRSAPDASREAGEIRSALFQERGAGLTELVGLEGLREDAPLVCHAREDRVDGPAHQGLGVADGAGGLRGERAGPLDGLVQQARLGEHGAD
jgi:hypothetical protein